MCFQHKCHICLICLLLYCVSSHADEHDHPSDHSHEHTEVDSDNIDSNIYLSKLMYKYGNGQTMTMKGFSHLLYHLGLGGSIVLDSHEQFSDHKHENIPGNGEHSHDHEHMFGHDHNHDIHEHSDMQLKDEHTETLEHHEHIGESNNSKSKGNTTASQTEGEMYDKLNDTHDHTGHVHDDRERRSSETPDQEIEQVSSAWLT